MTTDRVAQTNVFDGRELATILHALRIVQGEGRLEGCAIGDCEHFGPDIDPLTSEEIDALGDKIVFMRGNRDGTK